MIGECLGHKGKRLKHILYVDCLKNSWIGNHSFFVLRVLVSQNCKDILRQQSPKVDQLEIGKTGKGACDGVSS